MCLLYSIFSIHALQKYRIKTFDNGLLLYK